MKSCTCMFGPQQKDPCPIHGNVPEPLGENEVYGSQVAKLKREILRLDRLLTQALKQRNEAWAERDYLRTLIGQSCKLQALEAHSVERPFCNRKVAGSIPAEGSKTPQEKEQ